MSFRPRGQENRAAVHINNEVLLKLLGLNVPAVMNGAFVDKAGLQRKPCRLIQVNLVSSRQIDLIYLACIRELIELGLISLGGTSLGEWERRTQEDRTQSRTGLPVTPNVKP